MLEEQQHRRFGNDEELHREINRQIDKDINLVMKNVNDEMKKED